MATKNVFAMIGANDSDDDFEAKPVTKTTKKKEERKITEKEPTAPQAVNRPNKVNEAKFTEGGFEMSNALNQKGKRPQTGNRGGGDNRGRGRGEGRGGRGRGEGRGGSKHQDARPRTGTTRVNEQGEEVFVADKKEGGRFQGKDRGDHPFEKHSGAGRGTRKPSDKKGGAGRGNWGNNPDRAHKQGKNEEGGATEGKPAAKVAEDAKPAKVEEEKTAEPEEETVEVVLGVGLDDFLRTRTVRDRAQARAAEGIKGQKVEAAGAVKGEKAAQVQKKQYATGAKAGAHELLGFVAEVDDDEGQGQRGGRRGGRGRGGRGGRPEEGPAAGRRGDAKKALKKMTEEDFPTL